ncbi:hypothetical protein C8A05DRAFT_38617 [Staphylotrichum tortipilum]|uniref:Uncharacterized protein n=1 Tax=Staphylotrichum tortipilum TaxID=2831512 RepID=A0AAN6MCG5_9PEZI|nr:hypothetical protein C8A05DRAFT_38617 [Staphylotrichum longicolle]
MDPTTALFTFMVQTHPSVKAVHLIGSWDNFTTPYTMERDSKRDRGQWRGCYSFKDIVCDGDAGSIPKRNGGLKMGHTYYYYYELDASSETHDPTQPSTTTCPYLPGQTVNTLWIPIEQSGRKRSASLTSLREEDFKTMDPASKFVAPRPAPNPPEPTRRLGTAPLRMQPQKRPARSPSPSSRWLFSPRKLFSRKSSSSSLSDAQTPRGEDERSLRSSDGSRSRDISPESLRRFLVDDAPLEHDDENSRPAIDIPEDIVEENEDDDNFATSAVSETMEFTGLSPPPPRAASPATTILSSTSEVLLPAPLSRHHTLTIPAVPSRPAPSLPTLNTSAPTAASSSATDFPLSAICPALSPHSPSQSGFYVSDDEDEEDEDDDEALLPIMGTAELPLPTPFARNLNATLSTYSLPRTADAGKETPTPVQGGLLSSPIPDGGLGELVSELWMVEGVKAGFV